MMVLKLLLFEMINYLNIFYFFFNYIKDYLVLLDFIFLILCLCVFIFLFQLVEFNYFYSNDVCYYNSVNIYDIYDIKIFVCDLFIF